MNLETNNYIIQNSNDSNAVEIPSAHQEKFRTYLFSALLFVTGIAAIIWSLTNDLFWNADRSFLGTKFCLPLAIGFSLILFASFIGTKWRYAAFWSALALSGQAAALQMIDAGRLIHFQHYRSLTELLDTNLLAVAVFAMQFLLVAFAISKRLPTIFSWLNKTFAKWQIICIALILLFAGAAVTPDASIYLTSLSTAFLVQIINLANIILLVWAVPRDSLEWIKQKLENIFGEPNEKTKLSIDKFALISALFVIGVAGFLSYFVYQSHPHVPDETQYLFQANYLAAGQVTVNAPLVPEAFSMYMVPFQEAHWFSIFSPGWSAILAIGLKLNAVWLVNPLLAGICILLVYLFFQQIYSRRFARIGVLLLCCSPWFVFMAMSFMSHIFTLVCALSAAILIYRAATKNKITFAFCSGLFIGIISLIRPLDGAIVAVLLGIWTLILSSDWRNRFLNSLTLVFGTITTAAIILPYNKAVTGSATVLPMTAYYDKYFWNNVMSLGFGSERGMHWGLDAFPGHSPIEAVINTALNTFLLNTELLGWGIGSLLLALCFIFSGSLKKKDLWALVVITVVVGCYSLFWYHGGPDFGARYWFICIVPLIALTVRGIDGLSRKTFDETKNNSQMNPRIMLTVLILCGVSLLTYFPWRAVDKYYRYLEMQPGIEQLAKQNNFGKSLVLIRGNEHPDYQSAWILNPVNFEGDAPIYAWDKNPEIRRKLLNAYADRQVWIVDGPTLANGNYKISLGPISANDLLKAQE